MGEQITMFVEWLDLSTMPIVSQYQQDNRGVFLFNSVQIFQTYRNAVRATETKPCWVAIGAPMILKVRGKKKTLHLVRKTRGAAHLAD